ncbi:hypothetical protein WDU94_003433 [Cyamophila willieti]
MCVFVCIQDISRTLRARNLKCKLLVGRGRSTKLLVKIGRPVRPAGLKNQPKLRPFCNG